MTPITLEQFEFINNNIIRPPEGALMPPEVVEAAYSAYVEWITHLSEVSGVDFSTSQSDGLLSFIRHTLEKGKDAS